MSTQYTKVQYFIVLEKLFNKSSISLVLRVLCFDTKINNTSIVREENEVY